MEAMQRQNEKRPAEVPDASEMEWGELLAEQLKKVMDDGTMDDGSFNSSDETAD